jgi:hypothetical protein
MVSRAKDKCLTQLVGYLRVSHCAMLTRPSMAILQLLQVRHWGMPRVVLVLESAPFLLTKLRDNKCVS